MGTEPERLADWRGILGRYLVVSIAAHLIWEFLQLPLYTLWATGTLQQKLFAIVHCTFGDVMIAGSSLMAASAFFAPSRLPNAGVTRVWAASVALDLGYTIFSEWLNTSVHKNWGYSDLMPIVPLIGTGLTPVLQWLVVPALAMWIALGRAPWLDQRNGS